MLGDLSSAQTNYSADAATMTGNGAGAGGERGSCALQARGWLWISHRQIESKRDILRDYTPDSLGDSSSAQTHSFADSATMTGTVAGTGGVYDSERGACALKSRGCLQRAHGRIG